MKRLVVAAAVVVCTAAAALWARPQIISNPLPMQHSDMTLTSSAFADGGLIPAQYTCDGAGGSPPLAWSGVPAGAVSLALIVDDPDVPTQLLPLGVYDHWVLYNIDPAAAGIAAGSSAGTAGLNSGGAQGWTPPCPPPQYEPSEHRYVFALYALDAHLPLGPGAHKEEVLHAMQGHVLGSATLTGRYRRAH